MDLAPENRKTQMKKREIEGLLFIDCSYHMGRQTAHSQHLTEYRIAPERWALNRCNAMVKLMTIVAAGHFTQE